MSSPDRLFVVLEEEQRIGSGAQEQQGGERVPKVWPPGFGDILQWFPPLAVVLKKPSNT